MTVDANGKRNLSELQINTCLDHVTTQRNIATALESLLEMAGSWSDIGRGRITQAQAMAWELANESEEARNGVIDIIATSTDYEPYDHWLGMLANGLDNLATHLAQRIDAL